MECDSLSDGIPASLDNSDDSLFRTDTLLKPFYLEIVDTVESDAFLGFTEGTNSFPSYFDITDGSKANACNAAELELTGIETDAEVLLASAPRVSSPVGSPEIEERSSEEEKGKTLSATVSASRKPQKRVCFT